MCWNNLSSVSIQSILSEGYPNNSISQRVPRDLIIFGDSYVIQMEGVLPPVDTSTRFNIPDGRNISRNHERDTFQQELPDFTITLGVPNASSTPSRRSNNAPDPDEICHFMANLAMGDTPDVGREGIPLAPTNSEEPYMLSRFMTIRTPDEPLVYEAQQAIKAGRIFEGQNMLRRRQEDGQLGQIFLSSGSSMDVVTQGNIQGHIKSEDHQRMITSEREFQQRNM